MPPHPRFYHILKRYSQGEISAMTAADEIYAMKIAGYEDPSASEVVLWSKMAGFGIPVSTEEEARKQADEILKRLKRD